MLKGKAAIVTGSTSGIGLGIATALAAQGCAIMMNGFGEPGTIEAVACKTREEHGVGVAYSPADMSKPPKFANLIADTVREFGGVDILVNNAGIQHVDKVVDFPDRELGRHNRNQYERCLPCDQGCSAAHVSEKMGTIINIASAHGLVASEEKAAYVTAKHGIVGFTKVVAIEAANEGVTCNAICPGWVLTPLVQKQIEARAAAEGIANDRRAMICCAKSSQCSNFHDPGSRSGARRVPVQRFGEHDHRRSVSIDGGWVAQ